jgi:diguanylate cyclase (GGDEF)-like protein
LKTSTGQSWLAKMGSINRWRMDIVVTAAALLLAGIVLIVAEFIILRSSLLGELKVQMQIIADNSGAALIFNDRTAADEILNTLQASPSVDTAILYNPEGQDFAQYQRQGSETVIDYPLSARAQRVTLTYVEYIRNVEVEGMQVGTLFMRANLKQLYIQLLWYVGTTVLVVLTITMAAALLLHRMRRVVRHAEERVGYLAYYDTVTHLPNRHAFNERFEAMLREARENKQNLTLLFLDLDDFKVVNDTLGHHVGDFLLKAVAEHLSACIRQEDAVYRVGGDEFAMILPNVMDRENAVIVAEKFIRTLKRPLEVEGHTLYVSASIGISMYPQDGADTTTLLRNADAAMYSAKERGKNNFQHFSVEMHEKTSLRLALEGDLRLALERNEFEVHYQPIVALASGAVVAVEALLRWKHPEKGMISPNAFIPLAETTGLIVPIGEWVLRQACTDAHTWYDQGHEVQVSVNLSGRQFREEPLIDTILHILLETGLDPKMLMLEITESVLMEHAEATVARLYRLKDMGIYLSIDDFGTGYSSMTYLKRFPVAKLKIDQSFIRDIPDDSEDVAITTATIQMARGLKLPVVAEGIETQAQADFLRENGCELGQGYLFSRPINFTALMEYLKVSRSRVITQAAGCL